MCVCLPPPACANKEKGSGLCYDDGDVLHVNTGAGPETWWRLGMVLSNTTITATEPTVWLSRKTCNAQEIRELFVLRGKMEELLRTYNETTVESRQQSSTGWRCFSRRRHEQPQHGRVAETRAESEYEYLDNDNLQETFILPAHVPAPSYLIPQR